MRTGSKFLMRMLKREGQIRKHQVEKNKKDVMNIQIFEGSKNSIENIQPRSSKWCFIISLSLVALTIIYFIVGSFLAVGIKTNRDVSLAGNNSHY